MPWKAQRSSESLGRGRFDATVEFNRQVCREHFLLRLRVAGPFGPTQPGQFIQLGCRLPDGAIDLDRLRGRTHCFEPGKRPRLAQPELCGTLALLRRPFSIADRGDDPAVSSTESATCDMRSWLEVVHRVVGAGTCWLGELSQGDPLDLMGPLGNRFVLADDRSVGLVVGGGVGLPPMYYLARALHVKGWHAIAVVGAKSRDLMPVRLVDDVEPDPGGSPRHCVDQFARFGFPTVLATEDGSCGMRGLVTDALSHTLDAMSAHSRQQAVLFTCGPHPMMRAVAATARQWGVPCQVCLEQQMACGLGTCQSCVVPIEDHQQPYGMTVEGRPWRYRLTCTDGPVFDAGRVVW